MAEQARPDDRFIEIDGLVFNRDHIVAVTNSRDGRAIVNTRATDWVLDMPLADAVRILFGTGDES